MTEQEQRWIENYVNETLTEEDFAAFQDRLQSSAELRGEFRKYLALDSRLRDASDSLIQFRPASTPKRPRTWIPTAIAASIAFLAGVGGMLMWNSSPVEAAEKAEPRAEGFATVHRTGETTRGLKRGQVLGAETISLTEGTAEIHFFCGARVLAEAPLTLDIKSAWEAVCHEGVLRVDVPPAARGFRIDTASTEIVDLGTAFALDVRDGNATVQVLDGEVAVKHRDEAETVLTTGESRFLPGSGASESAADRALTLPDESQLVGAHESSQQAAFARWDSFARNLQRRSDVLAFYDFQRPAESGFLPNRSSIGGPEYDGVVILADPAAGRWPGRKGGMEFRKPGSRVRVRIPGEFDAFSFACWVRIDSLPHKYNALFLGDGYENGEPHWQINSDAEIMLSVMVDTSQPPKNGGLGKHIVYHSPPMWDASMSGQWMHVASTYDPPNRMVRHFVNGEVIHEQKIEDEFYISPLRIGAAEIGNWCQPFRKDPWWAIRNLNGRIDELIVFRSALSLNDVQQIFNAGTP